MKILAILERQRGNWHRMSMETLAAAQELGTEVEVGVVGDHVEGLAVKAYTVQHELLASYTADGYTAAFEALIRKVNPDLVLFPHTYQTRDFAPKLATRFERVLISDVIAVRSSSECGAGCQPAADCQTASPSPTDHLLFVRQLFQGKLNADIRPTGPGPHFVSLQAGAWRAAAPETSSAPVEVFTPKLTAEQIRQIAEPPFRESARAVDLTAAERIVSVGRGIGEKEKISVVEALASAMGAELAASRPICDAGWLPMERQVGSSGQTVAPKLYVAVGISGAIQHLVGMKGAKTIVAINRDANAPIFEIADYGIIGDLFEVVPALIEEIKKAK